MCAPLRSTVSHTPSPLERCGMDENAKITAAHANTGSHTVTTRDLVVTGGDASLRPTNRRAARESGASPERSRRCEGRRSHATCHWPTGWEGGEGGSPESEDLRRREKPNPSRKEDSCSTDAPSSSSQGTRTTSSPAFASSGFACCSNPRPGT